jgi:hypothetical protein
VELDRGREERRQGSLHGFSRDKEEPHVQVRKYGESSARWESNAIRPGQADNGRVAGTDRFTPRIYVDADGLTETAMTLRLRFSGC